MMIEAVSADLDADLRDFSGFLTAQGIAHRITEESGRQVVWVQSQDTAAVVREALAQWQQRPELQEAMAQARSQQQPARLDRSRLAWQILRQFLSAPVCSSLLLLCLLVALLSSLGSNTQPVQSLFYPLIDSSGFWALLADINSPSTLLRTLTPMLLHFGELHLIFNMLWLLYFGRQLEPIHPVWLFALLVLLLAFVSNTVQYLSIHYNNFGGMSGVVYGLVSYTWLIHNFMPRSRLMLNNSMFVFFVIALVLMEVFAGSYIATAAHIGGLLGGLLLGAAVVAWYRIYLRRDAISRH
jgi:GlpG protein